MSGLTPSGFALPEEGLSTARLSFRPPIDSDADQLKAIMSEGEVTRWLTDIPWPFEAYHARDWVQRCQRSWGLDAAYPLFAFMGDDLAGSVTLTKVNGDEAILGFWLNRAFWGQGLGLEMVSALTDWNFEQRYFKRFVAGVHPDNARSIKLLEALGYVPIGERMYILPPHDHRAIGPHYMLTDDNWQAIQVAKARAERKATK
ncbi:MAG: GNAT family N-acetyltransferase [Alphaproteobacteria bacterium]|nr:GNAT family N-acetyltransferase [Alphaproteobacteria bacterium SS10]